MADYPVAYSTLQARSGNGRHFYFKWTKGVRNSVDEDTGFGFDVRSDGGYVVAPPSIHENGKQYEWLNNDAVKPLSDKLKEMLITRSKKKSMRNRVKRSLGAGVTVKQGGRNTHLASVAGSLHARGMDYHEMLETVIAENEVKCDPPLPETEVVKIVESISGYPVSAYVHDLTEAGNARRFATQHGANMRYCHNWKSWFGWDENRWLRDEDGEALRKAKHTARGIFAEASAAPDPNIRQQLAMHGSRSEKANALTAMLFLAQSEPEIAIKSADFDRDPWLLNVQNGTVDLKTGILKPHDRRDLMTKLSPVKYSADAKCPKWEKFLHRIMNNNSEMVLFLQRAIGYSLTGDVSEQKFFYFYGSGANGKSTFLNIAREMLGDYAKQAAPELLAAKQPGSHPTDVADLEGSRFVVAVEVEMGRRMAEQLVKQLTGGDMVKARKLYQDFSEFAATFKLFLAANHKLTVQGDDHGIWRRVLLVPFEVKIAENKQDKRLLDKLRTELSGILAWAVKGCLDWQKQGLNPPPEVQSATEKYRSEMDTVETFLNDRCVTGPNERVKVLDLFNAFIQWCGKNGEQPRLNRNEFGTRLKNRGFKSKRRGSGWMWLRLGLNDERDTGFGGFGS
jgi:putative DNA primase/helicase